MTQLAATAQRRRQGQRYALPIVAVLALAMIAALTTLASSPSAQAQLDLTTCYSINDTGGVMVSFTGGVETNLGATGLDDIESLAANQDRNELWSFDNDAATPGLYIFTPGSATPTLAFAFTDGDLDSLTWVNHTDGDPSNDELWGTYRNGLNNSINIADEIVQIDPDTGLVISGPTTIFDPGAGTTNEQDDNDGLIWDPTTGNIYGVIGGDSTPNDLVIIDPVTGGITQIDLFLAGGDIFDIESLGGSTDGQLYGTTGEDPATPNNFVQIDKVTGEVTILTAIVAGVDYEATACLTEAPPIVVTPSTCYTIDEGTGNTGDAQHLIELAVGADGTIAPSDLGLIPGTLNIENLAYRNGFGDNNSLWAYDPSTTTMYNINQTDGTSITPVFVADIGDIDGLTWVNDNDADATNDQLWGIQRLGGEDNIVQIDPATGAILSSAAIATGGVDDANDVDGLAWDPVGGLVYAPVGGDTATNDILVIDPATGAITSTLPSGIFDIEGIGFNDAGELFGVTGEDGPTPESFLVIDKATGAATVTGALPTYVDFESLDCAGDAPTAQPDLDIRLDVIPAGDTCPADFAAATEDVGPLLPVAVGDNVTYCFKVINNGPGDATDVIVNHPALPAPINLGDIAAGAEAMDMVDDVIEAGDGETTATVDGADIDGTPVPQAEDPAGVDPLQPAVLDIRLDVIPAGDTCPANFAAATEDVGPLLPVAVGSDVTYCFKVINNGPGDATDVIVNHPALPAPINLGDIAAGAEAMDMVDDVVEAGDGETTATVDGTDELGDPVPQAEDPAGVAPQQTAALDIRLDVIPAGDTCPANFAAATEDVGPLLPVAVGDSVTYCFKVINNGPGDATDVIVNHPALPAPVNLGDIAAGAEAMDMVDDVVEAGDGETTATVDGTDELGDPIAQAEDPAGVDPLQSTVLDIRLDVIPAGDTCPANFAAATEDVGPLLAAEVGSDVTYCFKVINNGPGDATDVIVNHPALPAPINLGDIAAGAEAMDMVDDVVEAGDGETTATVDGTDELGDPIPQAEDPAGLDPQQSTGLDIRLDVIPAGDTCPADFAAATEDVGPLLPVAVGDNVTYCFKVINNGPGDATDVIVNHPALPAPINLGDIAANAEAMDMVDDVVEVGDGETTATVDGTDELGDPIPQAEDPAGVDPLQPAVLDIRLDVIPAGDTCPADFAAATEDVGPLLAAAVGDNVTYCFKVINNGPGDATDVIVNHPALPAPINLGDIAAGAEAMDMVDDVVEAGDGETTATVDGTDELGDPIPQAEDPAGVDPLQPAVLDIRLDVIPAGDTCPADFAAATEDVGPLLGAEVGSNVTYCFKVINLGPGDATDVIVNHPALPAPVNLGDIAAGAEAMDMVDDVVEAGDGETTATVDGTDELGDPIAQAEDPAGIDPLQPAVLDIRLDVIPAGDTCPADFAAATEDVGPLLAAAVGDNVTYCFKVINNGPGDATDVIVNHPALPAPINLGDIAAGAEAMDMVDDVVEVGDGETTATVDGTDELGDPIPQAEDPAGLDPQQSTGLDIRLDVIPAGDTCPADFAAATEDVGPLLPVAVGDNVTYCFKVINNGPGDATDVIVNHPALPAPINLGDIAANAEAMDMVDDVVEVGDGETTATVDGTDELGDPIPQAEDPAGVDPLQPAVLDIRLDVIPAGDTCPADFAAATEDVGPLLAAAVGDNVTYCFKVINNGPGDATDVIVNHPALPAPINLGDIAAGAEAMDMVDDVVEVGDGETTATVDGTDELGDPIPQAEDPAGLDPQQPTGLDIRLEVIPAGDTCPADFASAIEGDGPALPVAVGDNVTYCFKVINLGPGDATDVTVNHPALPAPINLGDIAAGAEAMDMVDDVIEAGDGQTTATVDGTDELGDPITQADDTALVNPSDPVARIGDLVWEDLNNDGLKDAAEPGVENVNIAVWNVNPDGSLGGLFDQTATDEFGNWFMNVPPGDYRVLFALPADAAFTIQDAGDDALDSDVIQTGPEIGFTDIYTVLNGTENLTIDAGIVFEAPLLGSIANFVFEDVNEDGVQDAGDTPVEGVLVEVLDAAGDVVGSDTTGVDGTYLVGDLAEGAYTVRFTPPAGRTFIPADGGADNVDSDPDPATNTTAVINLSAGENNVDVDAGLVPVPPLLGSIANFVFEDVNEDGVQDAGDTPVEGVLVEVLDAAGDVVGSDTTGVDGTYLVGDLAEGAYTVRFTPPAGRTFIPADGGADNVDSDPDPATNTTAVINLSAGENNVDVDAGLVPVPPLLGSIANFVFEDVNEDGVQDAGDTPVEGVLVEVLDAAGDVVGSDTTGVDGTYLVGDLAEGAYTVRFTPPAGRTFIPADGGADNVDSDPDPATNTTAVINLSAGENNVDVDAGLVPVPPLLGSIANFVFEDVNEDGVQDAGDTPVEGVLVEVLDAAGDVVGSDTTGVDGTYLVGDLAEGAYTVRFTPPAGRTFIPADGGADNVDSDPDPATNTTAVINLSAGENNVDVDAGLVPVPPPSEPAIGLAKQLTNGPTQRADGDWDFEYTFIIENLGNVDLTGVQLVDNIAAGLVGTAGSVVTAATPNAAGDCSTTAATGTLALAVGDSCTAVWDFVIAKADAAELTFDNLATVSGIAPDATVVNDSSDDGVEPDTNGNNIGDEPGENDPTPATIPADPTPLLGSISDKVFRDDNGDGIQDDGEPGIAGVTVRLTDGAGNLLEEKTTDADGMYLFDGLAAGDYIVEFVGPEGTTFSPADAGTDDAVDSDAGNNGRTAVISLGEGVDLVTVDAGIIVPVEQATIGDLVFVDTNGNGIQDAGEVGYEGAEVEVRDMDGELVARVTTDADGNWTLDVDPGMYVVSVTKVEGFGFSPATAGSDDAVDSNVNADGTMAKVTVEAGDVNLTLDAGIVPLGSIGNLVFDDVNRDGVQDPTDPPIAGATVMLFEANEDGSPGEPVGTQVTDANGNYSFDNLPAGEYVLVITPPTGFQVTTQDSTGDDLDSDVDPVTGQTAVISLGIGEENLTVDAGVRTLPTTVTQPNIPTSPVLEGPGKITNAPPVPVGVFTTPLPAADETPPLALTGSSSNVLVTFAVAMMAVGATTVIGVRRKRDDE